MIHDKNKEKIHLSFAKEQLTNQCHFIRKISGHRRFKLCSHLQENKELMQIWDERKPRHGTWQSGLLQVQKHGDQVPIT